MIESIVGVAGNVLDKFVADKDLKAKLDHELKTAFHSANLALSFHNLALFLWACSGLGA